MSGKHIIEWIENHIYRFRVSVKSITLEPEFYDILVEHLEEISWPGYGRKEIVLICNHGVVKILRGVNHD